MRTLTLCVAVALAACAQEVVWQKPGASDRDLAQDAEGCRAQAHAAQGMTADAGRAAIVYESCMENKGWRRVQTPKPS
jgi:hypothetical protein